jgi:hypothetical protein
MLFNFLVWKNSNPAAQRILNDLETQYKVRARFLVEWPDEHWPKSLARLYFRPVQYAPKNWRKLSEIGYHPFHFVVVSDPSPKMTVYNDKGILRFGNVNIFNSKRKYRNWAGTNFSIHSSIDEAETRWNLALILGEGFERKIAERARLGPMESVHLRSPAWGAAGWTSHADMFGLLRQSTKYAVMRHRGCLPDPRPNPEGPDIDILVEDVGRAANALNPKMGRVKTHSTICYVRLGGGWCKVELYDYKKIAIGKKWSRNILDNATEHPDGFRAANPSDNFYLLLHNGLTKDRILRTDYRTAITDLYKSATPGAAPPSGDKEFVEWSKDKLYQFKTHKGYLTPTPQETELLKWPESKIPKITTQFMKESLSAEPYQQFLGKYFNSTVWKTELPGCGPIAIKMVKTHERKTEKIFYREHIFLDKLKGPLVPELIGGEVIAGKYYLITKWVDAIPLKDLDDATLQDIIVANGIGWLESFLKNICDLMERQKISHRDLEKNILMSRQNLSLIDFGWSIFTDEDNPIVKDKFQNRDDRKDADTIIDYVKDRCNL